MTSVGLFTFSPNSLDNHAILLDFSMAISRYKVIHMTQLLADH